MRDLVTKASLISLLGVCTLTFAQETVPPEQYAEEESEQGATFQVQEGEVTPVSLLELIYQCTQPAPQAAGENLIVRGFNIVDARDYSLRGPRALSTSLARAELDAKAGAAEALNAVAIAAATSSATTDTSTTAGATSSSGGESEVLQSFSNQTIDNLSQVTTSSVAAVLKGGRTTGTGIISLGEDGMCVVVRYEVPLDQANYDPAQELQPEDAASDTAAEPEEGDEQGFEAPPPGSIGDY